jgi:hypothetical protein
MYSGSMYFYLEDFMGTMKRISCVMLVSLLIGGSAFCDTTENSVVTGYKKIENGVVVGYKTIENGVVIGYKRIEVFFVSGYKIIENKFVAAFLAPKNDSSTEQSKSN